MLQIFFVFSKEKSKIFYFKNAKLITFFELQKNRKNFV